MADLVFETGSPEAVPGRKGGGLGVPKMVHFGVQAVKKCDKNEPQPFRTHFHQFLQSLGSKNNEKTSFSCMAYVPET